jgi:hypothetical protein
MLINLLHKKWRIVVRSDKVHNEKFPDTHAVAILDDRKIHIRKSSLNVETVTHELVHALAHELSFTELQLDDDQIEEFFCELFAKYGRSLLQAAESVVKHYKK